MDYQWAIPKVQSIPDNGSPYKSQLAKHPFCMYISKLKLGTRESTLHRKLTEFNISHIQNEVTRDIFMHQKQKCNVKSTRYIFSKQQLKNRQHIQHLSGIVGLQNGQRSAEIRVDSDNPPGVRIARPGVARSPNSIIFGPRAREGFQPIQFKLLGIYNHLFTPATAPCTAIRPRLFWSWGLRNC